MTSYLLTFMAGMIFAVAIIVFSIGMPMEAMKYLSGAIGSLLFAWLIRPAGRSQEAVKE